MRIGLLVTSIGDFGKKGFYNTQEIGLAKALDTLVDEVKVYKLVPYEQEKKTENIDGCAHSSIMFMPSQKIGNNGLIDLSLLDNTLDAFVFFSDTQLCVPSIDRWAKENQVKLFPYIGVTESHSNNALKKLLIDWIFKRNLKVYKNRTCFVKTPAVKEQLKKMGAEQTIVTPVGLDTSLLKTDCDNVSAVKLKEKYGYSEQDKVLLFIGRLIDEKQPVRMIEILSEIVRKDSSYRLLMVGTGELKPQVDSAIEKYSLNDKVQLIERIPNSEIWELYRFAEAFVNLNHQEIFGMAILEAMYYGCKVAAWEAPGPSFIIENGVSGFLANSNQEIVDAIISGNLAQGAAKKRILDNFTWNTVAESIVSIIKA